MLDMRKLEGIELVTGKHRRPSEGLCLLEAFAFVKGIPHTDHPSCVCAALGSYGRAINDAMPSDLRQKLKGLIPALLDTNETKATLKRALFLADRAVRLFAPRALRNAALDSEAVKLEQLSPIVDQKSANAAESAAWSAANAAESAAWSAANAAESAAWSAARNAAESAAYAAESAAAYAARNAAESAAAYAANAAESAAESAANAAESAAWSAAEDAAAYAANAAAYAARSAAAYAANAAESAAWSAAAYAANAAESAAWSAARNAAESAAYAANAAESAAESAAGDIWLLCLEVFKEAAAIR